MGQIQPLLFHFNEHSEINMGMGRRLWPKKVTVDLWNVIMVRILHCLP